MPELPEVETIVRAVRPEIVGRTIRRFQCSSPRQVLPDSERASALVRGARITELRRRGKFIHAVLEGAGGELSILVHLRMSGRFEWIGGGGAEPRHVRAVWTMDDGRGLAFCDARRFGRIIVTRTPEEILSRLGVEPLEAEFTGAAAFEMLRRRRRRIKALLLDQRVIAGLGNIYTDEALFRAGLHPLRESHRLDRAAANRLRDAIREVLTQGIERQGASVDWVYPGGRMQEYFRVYGRTGEACRVCGTPVVYLRVGQRGTHVCPVCQPLRSGKQADRKRDAARAGF